MPCLVTKKIVWPTNKALLGCVTDLYAPIWVMGFCVLYHQTIIFTGKMVFIIDGQHILWSQEVCQKSISQLSGDTNLLTSKTVKKTQSLGKNGCRQKCLDKSLHKNDLIIFSIQTQNGCTHCIHEGKNLRNKQFLILFKEEFVLFWCFFKKN